MQDLGFIEAKAIQNFSNSQLQLDLPDLIMSALERRWLADFDIHKQSIVSPLGGDLGADLRMIQICEVAYGENISQSLHLHNMQNVISSLRDGSHSLIYVIHSDGHFVKLYMGVRLQSEECGPISTEEYTDVLYRALTSNYPGLVLKKEGESYRKVPLDEIQADLLNPLSNDKYLSCITGIPSLKNQQAAAGFYTQSIDRLVDALRNERYTLMVLAEPIADKSVATMIDHLRALISDIHKLVRQSESLSGSRQEQDGSSVGDSQSLSLGMGQMLATIIGISFQQSWSSGTSHSETRGISASFSQEIFNKGAEDCEKMLEHYQKRMQTGRNLGFWNTGVYLSSPDLNTFLRAQGVSRSLYSGENTYFEPLRLLELNKSPQEVRDALSLLRNPALAHLINNHLKNPTQQLKHPLGDEFLSLGTPMTTEELSILVNLPNREVPGLKLKPVADFNLNPPPINGSEIGSLLYRGEKLPARIAISPKSLTRHTFVTGLTGSGKTNTCLALLNNAYEKDGLSFLVIDPAKTEYRFLLNSPKLGKDLQIFTLGEEKYAPFRLNPFEFVRGFSLLSHIDLIKAVFNSAFPMYASMPYILEEALLEIYRDRGWDIARSIHPCLEKDPAADYTPFLPRLSDLYEKIDVVVASKKYGNQNTMDISAALKARLSSLLQGGKGLMLDTPRSISINTLLEKPVVLELRNAGDDDERAFIMALIFILLYEACQARAPEGKLQHVTLIEEAHRLLKNIPTYTSSESANPRGKTVEMFTDMMAEMRAHGEGFIIVDQIPSKLVPDVIKGSNLKIVHRLMAADDRLAVGNAMGLNANQNDYLPRLTVGQAIIHSEELEEACMVQIDSVEEKLLGGFSGANPVDRETDANARLIEKSTKFYGEHPEVLRRFQPCILCNHPCEYYYPDKKINPDIQKAAEKYLNTVILGTWPAVLQISDRLNTELASYEISSDGQRRCIRIRTAVLTSSSFASFYSNPESWAAVLELQTCLAGAWEAPPDRNQAMQLRNLVFNRIAIRPPVSLPGCLNCHRKCKFGFLFRNGSSSTVKTLAETLKRMKTGSSTFRYDPQKIIQYVEQQLGKGTIDPKLLPDAAYCLLTHCTADESILDAFYQHPKAENL